LVCRDYRFLFDTPLLQAKKEVLFLKTFSLT
jgi:hypothetical protein